VQPENPATGLCVGFTGQSADRVRLQTFRSIRAPRYPLPVKPCLYMCNDGLCMQAFSEQHPLRTGDSCLSQTSASQTPIHCSEHCNSISNTALYSAGWSFRPRTTSSPSPTARQEQGVQHPSSVWTTSEKEALKCYPCLLMRIILLFNFKGPKQHASILCFFSLSGIEFSMFLCTWNGNSVTWRWNKDSVGSVVSSFII
jgi:hypothetical protein